MKQSKLFPCYSIPMRDYFTSKGIRYELVGLHPKSHDMFWVYIKTTELEKSNARVVIKNMITLFYCDNKYKFFK